MAITFTKQPDNTQLISAFNNQIFEFSSNTLTAKSCTITNDVNSIELKLYPSPSSVFFVNLKHLYKTFFDFVDDVEISYGHSPNLTFEDLNAYKEVELTFTITDGSSTDETSITYGLTRSVIQDLENYKTKDFQTISPLQYTYFYGYPFDVQFYSPTEITGTGGISRLPNSLINQNFKKGINRVWGDIGDGNSQIFSIWTGTDLIQYKTKKVDCEGVYLKWLASDGSWRYWLFNQRYKETVNAKSLGQMDNDWNNPNESNAPIVEFGKSAEKPLKLHATGLEDYEHEHLNTLIDSPKVYLYKGTKGVLATLSDWYEVELVTNNIVSKNYERIQFNREFEIRHRINTMSLI